MFCKILRSPFKSNALCCFFTAFESHYIPSAKTNNCQSAGTLSLRKGYFTLRLKSELFDLRVKYANPIPQRTRCGAIFKTTYTQSKKERILFSIRSFLAGVQGFEPR